LSRRRLPPVLTGSQRQTAKTWSTPGTLTISANFLFDSSGPVRPCTSQIQFYSGPHSFPPGGEVFNEAEPCNIQVKNPPQKHASKKRPQRRSSTFDQYKVTARLSAGLPRVRQLRAEVAQGCSRTSTISAKNRSLMRRLTVQKSPKGAAGLAQ
jgi:hypothetical protein